MQSSIMMTSSNVEILSLIPELMDVWLECALLFWEAQFDHIDKILQGLVFPFPVQLCPM